MTTDTHYAYSTITNQIVHIDEAPNGGNCECVCLDCNQPLGARHGSSNTHHFYHMVTSNCKGGGETLLHLLTKEVISENNKIFIPNIVIKPDILSRQYGYPNSCNNNFKKELLGNFYKIKEIKLEQQISNIQPDIISTLIYDNKEYELLIEIAVTHFIDDEKKEKLINLKKNCIEIDMSSLYKTIRTLDIATIKKNIYSLIYNKYTFFNKVKIISFFIINNEKEHTKLNNKLDNQIKSMANKIIDNVHINTKFTFSNQKTYIEKFELHNSFLGKYLKTYKKEMIKNDFLEIVKIIEKDFDNNNIKVVIKCDDILKEINVKIKTHKYNKNDSDSCVIYFDPLEFLKNKCDQATINTAIDNAYIDIEKMNLYDEEKIKNDIKKLIIEEDNSLFSLYENFKKGLSNRVITLPNPSFKEDEIEYFDFSCDKLYTIETPKKMFDDKINIEVLDTEYLIPGEENILKIIFKKNRFFYLVFHKDVECIKKLDIYKNRKYDNISILFYKYDENLKMSLFEENSEWINDDFNYEWLYHSGYESIKKSLFQKTKKTVKPHQFKSCFSILYSYKLKKH